MAAGEGARLRPLTEQWPKPVLPIDGRPVLAVLLRELAAANLLRVWVVTGYLAEQVEAYLGRQTHFREWAVVPQGDPKGTGDALRKCRPFVRSEKLLVINGAVLMPQSMQAQLSGSLPPVRLARCCRALRTPWTAAHYLFRRSTGPPGTRKRPGPLWVRASPC